jgi:hypothetical protein
MLRNLSIADVAALLTAAGIAVYALGLIGLAVPIRNHFATNFSTAWYAVSLVPKTVVAGQGLRIWVQWPIAITTMLLFATVLLEPVSILLYVAAFVIVASIPFIFIVSTKRLSGSRRVFSILLTLPANAFIVPLGLISIVDALEIHSLLPPEVDILNEGLLLRGLVVVFLGSFMNAIGFAMAAIPPLPKVSVAKQDGVVLNDLPDPLVVWLVAHTDGVWHLFIEADRELLSIPDDKVLTVRTENVPTEPKLLGWLRAISAKRRQNPENPEK